MLKRYFVTGLLLWVPLVITVWVLNLIVGTAKIGRASCRERV